MKINKWIALYNAAVNCVNFCYSEDGAWHGTENIRADGRFLTLMDDLRKALRGLQPEIEALYDNVIPIGDEE